MKAEIITKRFVTCPGCSEYQHSVEHLFDGTEHSFNGWRCRVEGCRTAISGTAHNDGTLTLDMREVPPSGFALLKLRDLYLVKKELRGDFEPGATDYFYHSSQCPTNLLQDVVAVYGPRGEPDQHGMIRYVAGIENTPETREIFEGGGRLLFQQLLELFRTDGKPIASAYPEANEGLVPWLAERYRAKANSTSEQVVSFSTYPRDLLLDELVMCTVRWNIGPLEADERRIATALLDRLASLGIARKVHRERCEIWPKPRLCECPWEVP